MGAPASGKSTLASAVHTELKRRGLNSIFVGEAATDYIAEYGIPTTPSDQMVIFYKQLNRERMYLDSKEYVVCDSSSLLNYFYFRTLYNTKLSNKDIATINHIQKEILKSTNSWDNIYYVPPISTNTVDGIRFHDTEQISKIDRWIKSYLELEQIPHIDISSVKLNDRIEWVVDDILKKA
jgi:nicotinamide riboside kinase